MEAYTSFPASSPKGTGLPQAMNIVNKVDYMQLPQAMNIVNKVDYMQLRPPPLWSNHQSRMTGYAIATGYEYSQQS
jgi:hypothetical protein